MTFPSPTTRAAATVAYSELSSDITGCDDGDGAAEDFFSENSASWDSGYVLELPAGEVNNSPAPGTPRPALKAWRDTLPHPFRSRLTSGRELIARRREIDGERLPTAEPSFDHLLAGGIPKRTLTEVIGGRTSGRFSLLLTLLAATTGVGDAAVLVDLGDGLDPQSAQAAGVELARLLWLRPRKLQEALAGAETVLASGFPLVVLDLGLPPLPGGRGEEASWLRLARAAQERDVALVVAAPYRVSGTAAAIVLEIEAHGADWWGRGLSPRLLARLSAQLTVVKQRGQTPGDHAITEWRTNSLLGELTPSIGRRNLPASGAGRELPRAAAAGA